MRTMIDPILDGSTYASFIFLTETRIVKVIRKENMV